MQRFFFSNLIFLITVNLLIKPLWIFGIDRTVQNVVGAESYGIYFVLFSLSMLTQIMLDLGISNYNNRLIAQQEHLLNQQLSNIFSVKLILSGVYLLITIVVGLFLHYHGHVLYLLLIICLNQVLASLITYVRSNISALHHFKVDSMLSVMDKALMIIICGLLLLIPSLRSKFIIDWFVYAQLASYAITLFTALIYVLNISGKIPLNFSLTFSKDLLKSAFPFALLIALMMIYGRIDAVMIENLLPTDGEREAGLYASAFRLLDALNQFGYLFAVLLLPIFSRMLVRNQNIEELVKTAFTTIFISSTLVAVGLSFYAVPVMHLLYHESPEYSASILQWLIFCFVGTSTIYVFGTLLTANGNLYLLCSMSLVAVIVNLVLNLYFIPQLKAIGAAETATVTQILIAALNFLAAFRIFKWRINYSLIIKLIAFVLVSLMLFWGSKYVPGSWVLLGGIAGVLSLTFALSIGLIRIDKLKSLITS